MKQESFTFQAREVQFQGANRNQIFLGDFFQSAINKADSYVKEEIKKGVLTQQLAKDQLCLRSTRVSFLE